MHGSMHRVRTNTEKIFRSVLVAVTGFTITRVFDPATAQQLGQIISGICDLKMDLQKYFSNFLIIATASYEFDPAPIHPFVKLFSASRF